MRLQSGFKYWKCLNFLFSMQWIDLILKNEFPRNEGNLSITCWSTINSMELRIAHALLKSPLEEKKAIQYSLSLTVSR